MLGLIIALLLSTLLLYSTTLRDGFKPPASRCTGYCCSTSGLLATSSRPASYILLQQLFYHFSRGTELYSRLLDLLMLCHPILRDRFNLSLFQLHAAPAVSPPDRQFRPISVHLARQLYYTATTFKYLLNHFLHGTKLYSEPFWLILQA